MKFVWAGAVILAIAAACQTPAILDPTNAPGQCNLNSEHTCQDRGCCLLGWDCGQDSPSCPPQVCCDEEPNSDIYGTYGAKHTMWKRRP